MHVADKGILLTDGEDALIALAPDEATLRHCWSDTENPKSTAVVLTHIDKQNYPDAQGFHGCELWMNTMVTSCLILSFFRSIDECHFKFAGAEKVTFNGKGDSVFAGKVQGEPGTQNNEFVTYGQLATLEEELEQLAPSLERGSWNFTLNYPPGPGEYTMIQAFLDEDDQEDLCTETYSKCVADAGGDPSKLTACNREYDACRDAIEGSRIITTDNWTECQQLEFNNFDSKGVEHTWEGIVSDHYIDVFNEADDGFLVGDISSNSGGTINFTREQSKGKADGLASVKIFKTEGTVDFDSYIRKSGDTMTGGLSIEPQSGNTTLRLQGSSTSDASQNILNVYSNTGNQIFWVDSNHAGFSGSAKVPTSSSHITSKGYVDDAIAAALAAPARLSWVYRKPGSGKGPADGTFWLDSNHFRISFKTHNGADLAHIYPPEKSEWWAPGGEKYGARYLMTVWKRKDDGSWIMYDHIECDKTRWSITTDGVTHFQFRREWSAYDKSFGTGNVYYITVGGFF